MRVGKKVVAAGVVAALAVIVGTGIAVASGGDDDASDTPITGPALDPGASSPGSRRAPGGRRVRFARARLLIGGVRTGRPIHSMETPSPIVSMVVDLGKQGVHLRHLLALLDHDLPRVVAHRPVAPPNKPQSP